MVTDEVVENLPSCQASAGRGPARCSANQSSHLSVTAALQARHLYRKQVNQTALPYVIHATKCDIHGRTKQLVLLLHTAPYVISQIFTWSSRHTVARMLYMVQAQKIILHYSIKSSSKHGLLLNLLAI